MWNARSLLYPSNASAAEPTSATNPQLQPSSVDTVHTIIIPVTANPSINGTPIAGGEHIGVCSMIQMGHLRALEKAGILRGNKSGKEVQFCECQTL